MKSRNSDQQRRQALASIAAHSLLTTGQLHELVWSDYNTSYTRAQLKRLRDTGLVDSLEVGPGKTKGYFLTRKGVQESRKLPVIVDSRTIVNQLVPTKPLSPSDAHLLTVNGLCLLFVQGARTQKRPETKQDRVWWWNKIEHTPQLMSDAHIRLEVYTEEGYDPLDLLISVDNGDIPLTVLHDRLRDYARYSYGTDDTQQPIWTKRFPREYGFPIVLIVFDGGNPKLAMSNLKEFDRTIPPATRTALVTADVQVLLTTLAGLDPDGPGPYGRAFFDVRRRRWTDLWEAGDHTGQK